MRKDCVICLAWIIYIVACNVAGIRGGDPGMHCNYPATNVCNSYLLHGQYKQALFPFSITTGDIHVCESLCDKNVQCNSYSTNKSHCFISQCNSPENIESCTECYFASKINLTSAVSCSTSSATSSTSDSTTAQQESNRCLTEDITTSGVTTPSSVSLTVSEVNTPLPVASNATKPSNNETVPLSNTLGTTEVNGTTTWTQTFDTSLKMNENVSDPTIIQPINAVECVCVCKFTNQSVEDSIKIRKKALAVDKRSLTTTVRKLNSARDVRKSSKGIGALSVIVLITCGALVIFPDVFTCLNFLYKSILKKKKKKKRQVEHFHV